MKEYYCRIPTIREIEQAYPPLPEEEKQRDEVELNMSRERDRRLDNAIMDMWVQTRKACSECTPDRGGKLPPRFSDVDIQTMLVLPQACDEGQVRFVTVRCFYDATKHIDKLRYAVEINGNGITVYHDALEDAIEVVKKVMYGE